MSKQGKSPCPKCGCQDWISDARILDKRDHSDVSSDLEVVVYGDPNAILFKEAAHSVLRAWICTGCGYAELYAQELEQLVEAHRKQSG